VHQQHTPTLREAWLSLVSPAGFHTRRAGILFRASKGRALGDVRAIGGLVGHWPEVATKVQSGGNGRDA